MKCTFCGYLESKVIDSRPSEDGAKIRRRRECLSCGGRFTTYEIVETIPLMVVKKDNTREPFNTQKLVKVTLRACGKRPVSIETIENLVAEVEFHFSNSMIKEIKSTDIAEMVMQKLKEIDQVAYVRFASVYKEFADIDEFMIELKKLKKLK